MVNVSRPSGVNVGVNNPGTIVYIKGNETTDGSFRVTLNGAGTVILFEQRVSSVWITADIDVNTVLTTGQAAKADTDGTLIYGNATVDPTTLEWTFDNTINVPSGSISMGETMEISEGGGDIVVGDLIAEEMSFSVNSEFSDSTGSETPNYINFGAPQSLIPQPVFDTTLTANPLTFSAPVTVVAPDIRLTDQIAIKTGGVMTNFRAKVIDQTSGIVVRYLPNKASFDGVEPGLTLASGDNTFFLAERGTDTANTFYLGYVPFVGESGQTFDIEFVADTMDILGESGGIPYFATEVHDGPSVGLVAGPDTSTDLGIAAFDGTTGELLQSPSDLIIVDTANNSGILASSPSGTGQSQFYMSNSSGQAKLCLFYNEITGLGTIQTQDSTELVIDSVLGIENEYNTTFRIHHTGTLDFAVGDPSSDDDYFQIDGDQTNFVSSTADTTYQLSVRASGTNGGRTDIHVGDRDPESNVPGNGGNLYVRDDDTSSEMYLKRSTASSTEWERFYHTGDDVGGNVIGPGSSIDNSMAYWDGTDGTTLGSSTVTFLIEGASTGRMDIEPVTGSGKAVLTLSNNGGGTGLMIEHDDGNDDNAISAEIGPLTIETTDDEDLNILIGGATSQLTIANALSPDTNPLVISTTGGANGATVQTFYGTRNPEGLITGNPGDVYYRSDGVDSRTYQLERVGSGNTGWAVNQGSVDGPATSTDNAIALFDGTTGELLQDSSTAITINASDETELDIISTLASGGARLALSSTTTSAQLEILHAENTGNNFIIANTGDLDILNDAGNIKIQLNTAGEVLEIESASLDTTPLLDLAQLGTNGGTAELFVGTRNPEGNVTADGGSLYIRDNGTNSDLYLKTSDSSNTDWVDFLHSASGAVIGPASSTNNSLAIFDGTTGELLESIAEFTVSSSGLDRTLSVGHDTLGTAMVSIGSRLQLYYDDATSTSNITGGNRSLNITNDSGITISTTTNDDHITLETLGGNNAEINLISNSSIINMVSGNDDTDEGFMLTQSGTNGGVLDIHVGDRDPEGNIFGSDGAHYYRVDGDSSQSYIKHGSGSTGWERFYHTGDTVGDVSGPGSSTDNALAFFNGTSGDTLQQTINIIGEDAGATAYIDIRSSSILSSADLTLAHFDGSSTFSDALKIEYNQNGDTGSIQYLRSSNPFEITSAGELSVTAENDLTLNSTTGVVNIQGDFGALVTSAQADTVAVIDLRSLGTNSGLIDLYVGDRDPEGNVTGTGGDLYARDDNTASELYIKKIDSGTSGWHSFSVNGLNVYEIFSEDDFPNAPSGGEIDLQTGLYIIRGAFSTANKFVNSDADAVIEWTNEDKENHTMTSTLASDTLFDFVFSASGRHKIDHASFILSGNNVTLVDLEGGNSKWTDYRFTFTGTGSTFGRFHDSEADGGTNEVVDGTTVGFQNGLTLENVGGCQVLGAIYVSDFTGSGAIVNVLTASPLALNLSDLVFVGSGSQSNFYIDPVITRQADVINNDTAAATTFFEAGTTGSITLFADASISAQGISSVSDSSGVARFNWTPGAVVFVNQEVVISGYITNTDYNGTFIITTVGSGFFEVSSIAWGSGEATGAFDSDSVTVTSATHGQSDDQTLLITDTLEYNAGYKIYNALTNTYQINAVWDTAETTGTWDTGSLTEKSRYVLAKENGSQRDSKTLASIYVSGNAATTTITGVGTYDPLNLGAALVGQGNEQFTLIDATTGEMRYDGLNPFDGHLVVAISAFKSGGAIAHNFRAFKTVGAGAFDAVIVSRSIGTTVGATTLIMSVSLETGDQFRVEIEPASGTTSITVSELSLITE